jgi:hypothetical protein
MRCTACGKDIVGEYRYRQTANGFNAQHRACSATDKEWAKLDGAIVSAHKRSVDRLAAFVAFKDRWGTEALDEEIEQLRDEIGAYLHEG